MSEINTISGNTEYNGINVFKNATNVFTSDGTVSQSYATSAVGATDAASLKLEGILVTGTPAAAAATGGTDSLGNSITTGDIVLTSTDGNSTFDLNVIGVDTPTISMTSVLVGPAGTGKDETDAVSAAGADGIDQNGNAYASGASIYTDPDTSNVYVVSGSGVQGVNGDLSNAADAKAALKLITTAITSVAAERGTVGASINTLSAVGNVMTTQSTNTLAAENDVTATDYGQATSDMSKFQILSQTGIAALSQANQAQQLITKLLQ
jgi:flagellin